MLIIKEPLVFSKKSVKFFKTDESWCKVEMEAVEKIIYGEREYRKVNGE